jgi:hypothetical protein
VAVSVISKGSGSRSQVTSPLDRSVPHSRRVWKPLRLKLFCADPSVHKITLYERTVQNQEPEPPSSNYDRTPLRRSRPRHVSETFSDTRHNMCISQSGDE